ncbi:nucleoside phosphorylase domain-containing protein [Aspergillus varians]
MRPVDRDGFTTAITCALPLEADAVKALCDENYDTHGQFYESPPGNSNVYVDGRIGNHNSVLCYLPDIGKTSAASAVSTIRVTYREIKLVLVVGICGGLPSGLDDCQMFLGDVVISDSLVEYHFGSQYLGGFEQKTTRRTLSREALTLLISLRSPDTRVQVQSQLCMHLAKIQQAHERWQIPDSSSDVVYESSYYHMHHGMSAATCSFSNGDNVCEELLRMDCIATS